MYAMKAMNYTLVQDITSAVIPTNNRVTILNFLFLSSANLIIPQISCKHHRLIPRFLFQKQLLHHGIVDGTSPLLYQAVFCG